MLRPELRERIRGYLVTAALTLAVLSPLAPGSTDSFPLSTYPMFAAARGQPTLYAVIGTTRAGGERTLPAGLVASGEVLQTKVMIQRTVERGRGAMEELCRRTAARVASEDLPEISAVAVMRRRYDPIAYFVNAPTPLENEVLVQCPVVRSGSVSHG